MKNGPTYSIHSYDGDGNPYEEGIFLHFGDTRIKVAEDINEFNEFLKKLFNMRHEIRSDFFSQL